MKETHILINLQLLRFIAAFMIVLTHIILFGNRKYGLDLPSLFDAELILRIGVDIFFVISGFIMTFTTKYKPVSIKDFLYNRFTRVYPVYWIICLALLPILILKPEWINASSSVPPSFWHSFFLFPTEGAPLLMVAWTLEFEMFFYIIFALTMFMGHRKQITAITILFFLSFTLGEHLNPSDNTQALLTLTTSSMLLEFVAGMWLAHAYERIKKSRVLVASLFMFAIVTTLAILVLENMPRGFIYGIPAFFWVATFLFAEKINWRAHKAISLFGGNISYALYLVHIPVIISIAKTWQMYNLEQVIPVEAMLLFATLASIKTATILFYVIEKPSLKWLRNYNKP
ncbi:MAG: exopolysaccharide production protein ExoZ [Alphaproteobacteria bacterium]|jgi:exopolysaccharide production protein ExoZ